MFIFKFIKDIYSYKYVISNLVNQELTVKYKRSILGFFWSLLNPIAIMSITSVIFASIMRFELQDFVVFLFAGLLPWNFFALSVDIGSQSIINNEGFIKKIYLPKIVFPYTVVVAQFINMIFSMTALFIMMLFIGAKISLALLFLPISFSILFMFTFGFALIIATVNVYFRDMRHLIGVIMGAWYYLTPILYPLSVIPEGLRKYLMYNPAYYVIEMFRSPIYLSKLPNMNDFVIATSLSIFVFIFGLIIFYSKEKDFVYRL